MDVNQVRRNALAAAAGLLLWGGMLAGSAFAQGVIMSEPDDPKPVQITGCMTARTKSGDFILSGVFGRPVTVFGPYFLKTGLGHQVTLTGTWQSNGTSTLKTDQLDESRLFMATAVKITAKQCASPPSAPPADKPDKNPGSR